MRRCPNFTSTYSGVNVRLALVGAFSVITNLRMDLRFKLIIVAGGGSLTWSPGVSLVAAMGPALPRSSSSMVERLCMVRPYSRAYMLGVVTWYKGCKYF